MPIYLKYGDIKGEVTESTHKDWIAVHSFQFGVGRGISSGGGSGGSRREASAPSVSEIVVTSTFSVASPLLLKEALMGKAVTCKIDMTQTDAGKEVAYQKYILTNTMISGYSVSSGGDRPSESISLNFTKIDSEYVNIDDKFAAKTTGHVIFDIAESKTS